MTTPTEMTLEGKLETRIAEEFDAMDGYSVGELRDAIRESIISIWDHCYKIAAAVRLLQRAGEDLSFLNDGWGKWALLLAKCKVLPETLKTFSHRPAVLNAVAQMPLKDQAKLAKDILISVVNDGGKVDFVRPTEVPNREIPKVFSRTGIRKPEEQKQWTMQNRPAKHRSEMEIGCLVADIARDGAVNYCDGKEVFFPRRQLERVMQKLNGGGSD